jgi:hypothetical protein
MPHESYATFQCEVNPEKKDISKPAIGNRNLHEIDNGIRIGEPG